MENFVLWGAIVNGLSVAAGAVVGMIIRRLSAGGKSELSPGMQALSDHLFHGLALCVIWIGVAGSLTGIIREAIVEADSLAEAVVQPRETLIVVLSVALGAVIGHLLDLDGKLNRFGAFLAKNVGKGNGNRGDKIAEGFVTASLLFCVGAMAISGSFASGMHGDHSIQYAKSLIDCISSVVFGTTMGAGVALSGVLVFLYQGLLSLLAMWFGTFLSAAVQLEINVVGSLLIAAIGLNMLGCTKFKVMNYLPAMFLPIGLVPLFNLLV